jgi:hypothetical protein
VGYEVASEQDAIDDLLREQTCQGLMVIYDRCERDWAKARVRQCRQAMLRLKDCPPVSAGRDGSVRVWDLSKEALANKGCQVSHRNLSPSGWKKYFGDEALHLTCPNRSVHPDYLQPGRELALAGEVDQAISPLTAMWTALSRHTKRPSIWTPLSRWIPRCGRAASPPLFESKRAAEDFRALLESGPNNDNPEEILAKRRRWIEALESGRNPFDAATLEALRRDEM